MTPFILELLEKSVLDGSEEYVHELLVHLDATAQAGTQADPEFCQALVLDCFARLKWLAINRFADAYEEFWGRSG